MSGFLGGILIKLFAGGLICAITLILVGNGAQKEIARLGCAAFMIILIFSGIGNVSELKAIAGSFSVQGIEIEVDKAVKNSIDIQKQQISEKLAAYIEQQAKSAGTICTVAITCADGQEYVPQKISITSEGMTEAQKNVVGNIIAQNNIDKSIIEYK